MPAPIWGGDEFHLLDSADLGSPRPVQVMSIDTARHSNVRLPSGGASGVRIRWK